MAYSTTLFIYNLYIHPPIYSDRSLNTQIVRYHKLPCTYTP